MWEILKVMWVRIILCWSLLALIQVPAASGQQPAQVDSSQEAGQEGFYYDIAKTRLIRWLREHKSDISKETLEQLVQLVQDAHNFAKDGDYETALLLLDTATEIVKSLQPSQKNTGTRVQTASEPSPEMAVPTGWTWDPQVITGMDWWRQELELGFSVGADSSFLESSGNPYVGLRLRGSRESTFLGSFETYAVGKMSRDYYSGEFQLKSAKGDLSQSHWIFENRFETTQYK